jgi:hypothetical protein
VLGNVGGNVTGSVGSVLGNLGGNVNGNVVGSVGSVLAAVTVGTNLDKTGYALSIAGNNAAADQVWEEAIADHSATVGSTAEALANAGSGGVPPTVPQIVSGVWNELIALHLGAGTTGLALNTAATAVGSTPGQVATAVWQALKTANQGGTIMGNIAEDLDNQEFTGEEG